MVGDAGFGDVALDHGAAARRRDGARRGHDRGRTRGGALRRVFGGQRGVGRHAFPLAARGTEGAVVRVLEHPERCATVAADGAFALGGFAAGEPSRSRWITSTTRPSRQAPTSCPRRGWERVTFQAPTWTIYRLMANAALAPLPDRCQIATTVTEVGRSLYSP